MMKFRQIRTPKISVNGKWIALAAIPDRGDPEVQVHSTDGRQHYTVPLARDPLFSRDGSWLAAVRSLPAETRLDPVASEKKNTLKEGMILLETGSGRQDTFPGITEFRFTSDSRWLLIHHHRDTALDDDRYKNAGTSLLILSLKDRTMQTFQWITRFEADSSSRFLAMAVADTSGSRNGVYILDLTRPGTEAIRILGDSGIWADYLTWNNRHGTLAFLSGQMDEKERQKEAALYLWDEGKSRAERVPEGDKLYSTNQLIWSKDGNRLFVGTKPESEILRDGKDRDTLFQLYDTRAILNEREVDVWHWNDPYIIPNQKIRWKRQKDRTYPAVYYPERGRLIQLATPEIPEVRISESPSFLLASTNLPHAKRVTWEGTFRDYYLVDLSSGEKRRALENHAHSVSLSPDGKYLVYFADGEWCMMESATM